MSVYVVTSVVGISIECNGLTLTDILEIMVGNVLKENTDRSDTRTRQKSGEPSEEKSSPPI